MTTEIKNSQNVPIENGLVAFFDILGYAQLINNDELENVIQTIEKSFVDVIKKHSDKWEKMLPTNGDFVPECLIFSDSILVTLPIPTANIEILLVSYAVAFGIFCQILVAKLFESGLPVRGAISIGKFYVKKHPPIFAGRPIVEAHQLCNSLELAGCVISPASESAFGVFSSLFQSYSVPIKDKGKQKLYLLDYFSFLKDKVGFCRQTVIESFKAHNKHIPLEVIGKVNNTVEFLEHCKVNEKKRRKLASKVKPIKLAA